MIIRSVLITGMIILGLNATLAATANAQQFIEASGTVIPVREVDLATKLVGRVTNVMHDEAETVDSGEILLQLDDAELQAELASAQATLSLTKAEYNRSNKAKVRAERLFKAKHSLKRFLTRQSMAIEGSEPIR